ncbi:MAG: hypothetical protein IT492_10720 [Gammaproteobacteria bacterium]|nr:hypothetical protein [Gammaproteobacteria bacterium]
MNHLLDEVRREAGAITRLQIQMGELLLRIKQEVRPEEFWASVRRIGLEPAAAQLAMQVALWVRRDPSARDLPINELLARMSEGRAERANALFDVLCDEVDKTLSTLSQKD